MNVIIPDPDLRDEGGHHANYDFSIAGELSKRSIRSVIFADQALHEPPSAKYMTVVPVFSSITSVVRSGLKSVAYLMGRKRQSNRADPVEDALVRPEEAPSTLRSMLFRLGALASAVYPVNNFGHLWHLMTKVTPHIHPGDLILISVYSPLVLLTRALWFNLLGWRNRRIRVVVLMHQLVGPKRLFSLEMKVLRMLGSSHEIIYVAHTRPLADHCYGLTGVPFSVLPYPFSIPEGASDNSPLETGNRPPVFAYLGGASIRRGFDLLVGAIGLLRDRLVEGELVLKVQARQSEVSDGEQGACALKRLERFADELPGLELIREVLPAQRFYSAMRAADLILIPHRPEYFPMARSGVFSEALSLGKPVIVSGGTYMAEELGEHGAGVVFDRDDAASLAATIREAVERIEPLREQAAAARPRWLELHNPTRFIDELLCLQPTADRN